MRALRWIGGLFRRVGRALRWAAWLPLAAIGNRVTLIGASIVYLMIETAKHDPPTPYHAIETFLVLGLGFIMLPIVMIGHALNGFPTAAVERWGAQPLYLFYAFLGWATAYVLAPRVRPKPVQKAARPSKPQADPIAAASARSLDRPDLPTITARLDPKLRAILAPPGRREAKE